MKKIKSFTYENYVKQYNPMIKGFSYKYKVNGYDVEDIQQELYMVLYKCIQNFDESKSTKFITYLQKSLFYHIVKLRNKHKNDYFYFLDDVELIADKNEKDIYELINEKEIIKALDNIKYGEYLKMYYLHKISMKRIGDSEGISKQAVEQFIKKGLKNLKKELDY